MYRREFLVGLVSTLTVPIIYIGFHPTDIPGLVYWDRKRDGTLTIMLDQARSDGADMVGCCVVNRSAGDGDCIIYNHHLSKFELAKLYRYLGCAVPAVEEAVA
jgi:hypothetical protein